MEKDSHTEEDEEKERNTERRHHDVCRIQQKILIFPTEAKNSSFFHPRQRREKFESILAKNFRPFRGFAASKSF